MAETPTTQKTGKFPSSIPYIIGNEAAERFNYYGMTAILTTFLIHQFYNPANDPALQQVAEATANAKNHDFKAMVYLLPMFGGMVADWFWGKYNTIFRLSLIYAIGSTMVALSVNNEVMFSASLMLIAMGAGGIKPCVSANVGDQFDESNSHMITKAFSAFYFSINAGSLLSILLIPYLNKQFGPMVAFGVPAIAMLIATFFFWAGRNKYRRIPPPAFDYNKLVIFLTAFLSLFASYLYLDTIPSMVKKAVDTGGTSSLASLYPFWDIKEITSPGIGPILGVWLILVLILAFIFKKQWFAKPGNFVGINLYALSNGGFSAAANKYGNDAITGIRSVWNVLAVFAFVPVFWALWDQSQSEWVVQATKMDLNWLGIKWEAEQISFVNAAFILLFIPLFTIGTDATMKGLGLEMTKKRKSIFAGILSVIGLLSLSIINGWVDIQSTVKMMTPEFAFQLLSLTLILAVIFFIPLFSFGIFPSLTRMGLNITPMRKIGAGLVLTALSFVIIAIIQGWIDGGETPNIYWQIIAFVVLTAGEVLISITCLEYAYTQAPPSMKSTIMACYLLTVTLGNVIVSVIQTNIKNKGFFAQFEGASFFWLFTGICAGTAVLFMLISPRIKEKSYII